MKAVFQLLNAMVHDGEVQNYAIGGAIAAVFYVEPFATQDIDVFVDGYQVFGQKHANWLAFMRWKKKHT